MRSYRALRPLVVLATALLALLFLATLSNGAAARVGAPDTALHFRGVASERSLAGRIAVLRPQSIEQAGIDWRGGPIVASTGETVEILVSNTFPVEAVMPENWAEFLVHLTHGSELSALTMYLAPLDEVELVCGGQALGCYSRNTAIALGEPLTDGTTPEEVVRHEYGHHIALYRSNTPWRAIDWGPKYWASSANVCARVARREAYPGDEGENYAQNPGEAWAETYRLMDERKVGILTAHWQIVAPSFFPTEAALQAADRDVVQPWTTGHTSVSRRTLRKGQVWWVPLSTPLDGSVAVTVRLPKGGLHQAALVAANRRTVLKRGSAAGQLQRRISGTVCGQRSVFVRVTQKGAPGRVTVTASTP